MIVSLVAYSWIFGWMYALGFIILLYIHEMGHYIAAKHKGIPTSLPMFIPFVGAMIAMKKLPMSVSDEAYIGFAGPFVGTLASLLCYYLARYYGSDLLLAISYSGFFLNLFNLIPISPLDGGRITAIISPRVWLLGVPILIVVFFYLRSPMLILILLLASPQLLKAWKYNPKDEENIKYYKVSLEEKLSYTSYYFALVIFLSAMTYEIHLMLKHYH